MIRSNSLGQVTHEADSAVLLTLSCPRFLWNRYEDRLLHIFWDVSCVIDPVQDSRNMLHAQVFQGADHLHRQFVSPSRLPSLHLLNSISHLVCHDGFSFSVAFNCKALISLTVAQILYVLSPLFSDLILFHDNVSVRGLNAPSRL